MSRNDEGDRLDEMPTADGGPERPRPSWLADFPFLEPARDDSELARLGPYRILGVLGQGGMGVVFRAEDTRLLRPVALKVQLSTNESARQRFLREARAMASIKHDHVATIYAVDEANGVPYLAMELLEGETLEARLGRVQRLPIREVLRVGREVASGLQAAHEHGLIHRDVKPANLWLESSHAITRAASGARVRDRIKVLDFGLVRGNSASEPIDDDAASPLEHHAAELTQSGTILGTPAFMSPEQASLIRLCQLSMGRLSAMRSRSLSSRRA